MNHPQRFESLVPTNTPRSSWNIRCTNEATSANTQTIRSKRKAALKSIRRFLNKNGGSCELKRYYRQEAT